MKTKTLKSCLCLLLMVCTLLAAPRKALAAGATVSGNSTVKAGDSVTLTLSVTDKICGLSCTLSAGDGLTFSSYTCADSNLSLTVNGNKFAAYGTTSTTGKIITVTLKVDSGLAAGTALTAAFKDVVVSDGETDTNLGTVSWSGTVADKPSNVCHLTAIRCGNATLSPAFNKDTLYYTANVPYSVSKLSLDYDRADKTSTVSISSTELSVGANTITMKCTAADGTSKTYTISVTRQQDPNYKPSTDATLKELKLDVGTISPAFNAKRTEYVAYVPYETKEATLSGVANDDKAVTSGDKTVKLTREGANDVKITCTAEDGKTLQTYTVHVFRMPVYVDILPTVEVIEEPEAVEEPVEETPTFEIPAVLTLPWVGEVSTLIVGAVAAFIMVALFVLMGILIGRGTADREDDEPQSYAPVENKTEKPAELLEISVPIRKVEPEVPAVKPAEVKTPAMEEASASDEEKAADEAAQHMSLDELLNDIRDM